MRNRKIRLIAILFAVFLVLINLVGCSADENVVSLTKSNLKNYVDIDCRAVGASSTRTGDKYYGMVGSVTTKGKSGYCFENVSITITIYFDDGQNDAYPTLYLNLDSNGNDSEEQYFTILNKSTKTLAYVTSRSIAGNSKYVIESVSGSVKNI